MEQRQQLPNAVAVLVLGICSIVINCYGVGLILGIIGLALSSQGRKMHKESPDLYEGWGNLNAGFIMSIIGVVFGALWIIFWIIWVAVFGGMLFSLHHADMFNQQ
jgi:hypothetical protein